MQNAQSPDPISDPKGYQNHLLGLLGDDDPAAVQASTPPTLRQFAAESGPYLPIRPEPAEWSALECIAHIVDAEIVMSARYRWVLAQDEPPLIGYDQDQWIDGLHADESDTDGLIDLFAALRLGERHVVAADAEPISASGSGSTPSADRRATTWRSG